jgi:hypothetical protein
MTIAPSTNPVLAVLRRRHGRWIVLGLCAICACAGLGGWALLGGRASTAPPGAHLQPALSAGGGTAPTSIPPAGHGTAVSGDEDQLAPGLGRTGQEQGPPTAFAGAQPRAQLPEFPATALVPVLALVILGVGVARSQRPTRAPR